MKYEKERKRLEEICKKNKGRLEPSDVVEAAEDENSPLHRHFTWDDTKAAKKQRLQEARILIRAVPIRVTTEKIVLKSVAYVRDPTTKSGYLSVVSLRTDKDKAHEVIMNQIQRGWSVVRRIRELAEVLDLEREIELLERGLKALEESLEAA